MTRLTFDHLAHYPLPGTVVPALLAFSPDGKVLTYLHSQDGTLSRVLWAYDLATGERRVLFSPQALATEGNLSAEEKLRRERQRQMHIGVTSYAWARDVPVLLVPVLGDLWVIDDGRAEKVGSNALDPRLSPDGARIAFVRDGELWCLDIATGEERRLTHDAEPGVTNGLAEFVAQEEMNRSRGHWWSGDSAWLAFEQADERHIPVFRIPHWGLDEPTEEEHRYPFAGKENARVRLGVVAATGGDVTWIDLGDAEYLSRVDWHPDGLLFVQTMNREQTEAVLRAHDPRTGQAQTLLTETSDVWVNLNDDLRFIEGTGEFIWASERTGFKQLYLYASDGTLVRQITDRPAPVGAVLGLDEGGRRVAYTTTEDPRRSEIWIAGLDDDAREKISRDDGSNAAAFSGDLSTWVEVHHDARTAPGHTLRGSARADAVLHAPEQIDLDLRDPEFFTFPARDGELLHGVFYRPGRLPAPLVVEVYGGPHAQMVMDSWGVRIALQAQYLAQEGFAVIAVDNRGSAGRGLAFEGAVLRRMGSIEIDDQVDAVRYAQAQGWVDGDRVGMTGWSYGGYMTIMSMLKAPEVFRAGVAGAPTIAWDGYDTFYTERYMRTPLDNPDGYRDGSALTHAAALEGKLLIVHGMVDENVHFRHTARFLNALQKAGRSCDLMAYPEERHSPRSEPDRRTMHEKMAAYLQDHL